MSDKSLHCSKLLVSALAIGSWTFSGFVFSTAVLLLFVCNFCFLSGDVLLLLAGCIFFGVYFTCGLKICIQVTTILNVGIVSCDWILTWFTV